MEYTVKLDSFGIHPKRLVKVVNFEMFKDSININGLAMWMYVMKVTLNDENVFEEKVVKKFNS